MSRDRITYNPPRRVPTMMPERHVNQLIAQFFRSTNGGKVGRADALRKLINVVYAQGVTAGQGVIEQPAERGAEPDSLPPRGVDLRYQSSPERPSLLTGPAICHLSVPGSRCALPPGHQGPCRSEK